MAKHQPVIVRRQAHHDCPSSATRCYSMVGRQTWKWFKQREQVLAVSMLWIGVPAIRAEAMYCSASFVSANSR